MKFKKLKTVMLALTVMASAIMTSGCSIPFLSGNAEEQKDANEEEGKNTGEDNADNQDENTEDGNDEGGWEADLEIPVQHPDGQEPADDQKVCICNLLCTADEVDMQCPVCSEDFHRCIGKAEEDPLDEIALPEGQTATASIIACGSNFLNNAAINGTDKSYKYDYMYDKIKDTISGYDVRIVTQETVFTNDPSKYSGTNPCMAPISLASALSNAGFNVIASATDHSFDNGKDGVLETLNAWNSYSSSTLVTGLYASEDASKNVSYMDINGIRIAFLSYTAGMDGMTLTNHDKMYVKTLYDEDSVADDISYASKIADFVVVLPHWGAENSRQHTANQEQWAQIFADNGADLIIGTGSDYLLDVALVDGKDGQAVPCYYSLGNFVSGKEDPKEVLSGAATITITKTGKDTKLENYGMNPVALHVSKKGDYFQPYNLSDYSQETIKWHNLVQKKKNLTLEEMQKQFDETITIQDISTYQTGEENGVSIGQQQVTTPDTDTSNEHSDIGTESNGNIPETSNPVTEDSNFSGIQVIGH